jgi:GT2 family glycosyltransferase
MTSNPLITTIIPTYRRPQQLRRAIQSVLAQTYPHFQIYVYDNASGDETIDVVAALAKEDPRVHYFCHSENIKAAPNFEYGMLQVKTPFFSILSDDDILLPEFYQTAMKGFDKHPEAAFSAGAVIDMAENGQFIAISKTSLLESELRVPPQGLYEMIDSYINWTGILFRKEVIEAIGGIDKTVKPIDVDFVLKAAARFPYVVSQKPCALFMHHSSSYSGNCGLKLVSPSWSIITENLKKIDCLSELEKEKLDLLMKVKMRGLLTSIAIQDILHKNMQEIGPISDLLMGLPMGRLRGKVLGKAGIFCKKNTIVQKAFQFFVRSSYQTFKFMKNYRARRQYKRYTGSLEEKRCEKL